MIIAKASGGGADVEFEVLIIAFLLQRLDFVSLPLHLSNAQWESDSEMDCDLSNNPSAQSRRTVMVVLLGWLVEEDTTCA